MQLGQGVEWGLHACAVLALVPAGKALPASKLAEYHGVPSAYLAKHLQALSRAGVVETVAGRNGGYRLARPAHEITVLDVVDAVEGDAAAFRCTEIRRRGPAAGPRRDYADPCAIARVMGDAESAWRAVLAATSIIDVLVEVAGHATPVSIRKTGEWLQEAIR